MSRWRKGTTNSKIILSCFGLSLLLGLSLSAPLLCNSKPFVISYQNHLYFPFLKHYPAETFGDFTAILPNYKIIAKSSDWSIFPLVPYGENETMEHLTSPPPTPPDKRNWLGTDDRGRDVLTRLWYGLRNSLSFALCAWFGIVVFAIFFGLLPAYFGGKVDFIAQRSTEIWQTLPGTYVILFFLGIFSGNFFLLITLWTVLGWVPLASLLRSEGLKLRQLPYIASARTLGLSHIQIFFHHILRNAFTPILTLSPFIIAYAIIGISALDYLGLGLPPPTASWGELLRQGKENFSCWWLIVFPFFSLFIILFLLLLLGEAIRQHLQKKVRYL